MNKSIQGDEWLHRLSSFLFQHGNLEAAEITRLKSNVYIVRSMTGKKFIVKGHLKKENVRQQRDFFNKWKGSAIIPFIDFPNGKKIISGLQYDWALSEYIDGNKLNYKYNHDRIRAIETVQAFHKEASNIHISTVIEKDPLFFRWYHRLLTFKETKQMFYTYEYKMLYNDIVKTSFRQLRFVSTFPWDSYEKDAKNAGQWVHGDVAAHNFIAAKKETYLIDFDLLQSTYQLYDFIQLGQRFLPYINWDLEWLLRSRMVRNSEIGPWLSALTIPSDLHREWLYFIGRTNSPNAVKNYLKNLNTEWMKRKTLIKNVRKIL